jgi:hypothetical protein
LTSIPYYVSVFCSVIESIRETNPVIEKKFVMPLLLPLLLSSALFPVDTAGAQQAQGPDPSSYRLIGTITADGLTGAVLVDAKGEQTFYRLHERLQDGSQLAGVRSDSILLKRDDGLRDLYRPRYENGRTAGRPPAERRSSRS